jgi:CCR4-NOT transcriptional regulation complex NOT5 subunit
MSEEIKPITLSGTAASEYMGGSIKRKKGGRKTQKAVVKGGSTEEEGEVIFHPTLHPTPEVISVSSAPTSSSPPIEKVGPIANSKEDSPTKQIKVELKKRGGSKRVHLQPKKDHVRNDATSSSKKSQTRRVRHFTLGVSSLKKRMTRAKKMRKKVEEMSLDQLKELLIQKKLIQPTSKAPEQVLRQIASDAQIVAGKAL